MRKIESTSKMVPLQTVTRSKKVDSIDQANDHPAARRRERERCEAILNCDAASALPKVAQALAFQTTLPRSEAIPLIQTLAKPEALPFIHLRPKGRHLHLVAK